MSNYRFDVLSDREFETLCCDILTQHLNVRIELFKAGKDNGIDGRFFVEEGVGIIQCKRYIQTSFATLLASLKKELPKVKELRPKRYIVATSLELSPANKTAIFDLFNPYIKSESDIYSGSDLLNFLDNPDYEAILKKHYKLWFTGTSVLEKILNNAIIGRSQAELSEIINDSTKHVITSDFDKALDRLKESHTVILTGSPGIGKTTLARLLILHYVGQFDFEFYTISNDLSEFESIWHPDKAQLFYFDDFLGRNYLDAIDRNADSHIMYFISRVKKAKNKRFILTSRIHILNRAFHLSQIFQDKNIRRDEYEVEIENLSLITKAKILYSHIFHSDLPREFIDEVYAHKKYFDIIRHKNFNPRLISYITDKYKVTQDNNISAENYLKFIDRSLNTPSGIWENTFLYQLTELQRYLVIIVFWNKSKCLEPVLQNAFEYIKYRQPQLLAGGPPFDFYSNIYVTARSLLTKSVGLAKGNTAAYTLFNPSLGDYLLDTQLRESDHVLLPLLALKTQQSLSLFLALGVDKYKFDRFWVTVAERIFENFKEESYSCDYIFDFCHFILSNKVNTLSNKVIKYIQKIDLKQINIDNSKYLLYIIEWFTDNDIGINLSCLEDESYVDYLSENISDFDTVLLFNKIIRSKDIRYTQGFIDAIERNAQSKAEEFAQDIDIVWDDEHLISETHFYEKLDQKLFEFLDENNLPIDEIDLNSCIGSIDASNYIIAEYDYDYEDQVRMKREDERFVIHTIEGIFYRDIIEETP